MNRLPGGSGPRARQSEEERTNMVTIKNVSDRQYQAVDHDNDGRLVVIGPDAEREVSDKHAEQLLKDFPKRFKKVGGAKAPAKQDEGAKVPAKDAAAAAAGEGDGKGGAS